MTVQYLGFPSGLWQFFISPVHYIYSTFPSAKLLLGGDDYRNLFLNSWNRFYVWKVKENIVTCKLFSYLALCFLSFLLTAI